MDSPYIGVIVPWSATFAPVGWLLCQGQTVNINQYQALYALIGNIYGPSTSTTFVLPNLCGRTVIGTGIKTSTSGTYYYNPGVTGGNETATILPSNLPLHTHAAISTVSGGTTTATFTIPAKNAAGNTNTPSDTTYFSIAKDGNGKQATIYNNDATVSATINMPGGTITVPAPTIATAINPAGGLQSPAPINTITPYIALNYIIAVQGLFPERP